MLAQLFLKQAVEKIGLEQKKLAPAALRLMREQKWAGTVRALRNVIEQGAVMSEGEVIRPEDFPFAAAAPNASPAPAAPEGGGISVHIPPEVVDLKAALKEVTEAAEKIIIERALTAHRGNRTHAAEALGLSRRALITKVQSYKLD
jgi:two-component system response regulator AtoC